MRPGSLEPTTKAQTDAGPQQPPGPSPWPVKRPLVPACVTAGPVNFGGGGGVRARLLAGQSADGALATRPSLGASDPTPASSLPLVRGSPQDSAAGQARPHRRQRPNEGDPEVMEVESCGAAASGQGTWVYSRPSPATCRPAARELRAARQDLPAQLPSLQEIQAGRTPALRRDTSSH